MQPTLAESEKRPTGAAPVLLALTGIGAAFGLAACCALPILLAGFGIGTAWLTGVALVAAPHRTALMVVAVASLIGGALLLGWQSRRTSVCEPGAVCAKHTFTLDDRNRTA